MCTGQKSIGFGFTEFLGVQIEKLDLDMEYFGVHKKCKRNLELD